MKHKVLVIGHTGLLGSQMMQALVKSGYDAIGSDLSAGGIDITNQESVAEHIQGASPWAVINCAAYTDVENCEDDKYFEIAKKVNGKGPGILARYCLQHKIHFVHFSSETVFGLNKQNGYTEDFKTFSPLSNYAKSKLMGEEEIIAAAGGLIGSDFSNQETRIYIIRTSWLFGPGAKNFINKILKFASEKDEIEVVTDEVACPTYTLDLANETVSILAELPKAGIYYISGNGECSRFEFAKEIINLAGLSTKVLPTTLAKFKRRAKIANYGILVNTKLHPMRTWQEMLSDYMKTISK